MSLNNMKFNSTILNKFSLVLISLVLALQSHIAFADTSNAKHPTVKIETSKGDIIVELYPDKAPISVANFLSYVKDGTYDGTIFHRVIKDFMNQGGGFTEDFKKVEAKDPIQNEADNGLKNLKNTIAMARTNAPHSATNQFFINTKDNAFLDHTQKSMRGWGYTVFGKVVEGENIVGAISRVPTGSSGPFAQDVPRTPIIIKKITKIEK
jgi:cyclophilin family peptidyl-prolyl cis-trans isomerase